MAQIEREYYDMLELHRRGLNSETAEEKLARWRSMKDKIAEDVHTTEDLEIKQVKIKDRQMELRHEVEINHEVHSKVKEQLKFEKDKSQSLWKQLSKLQLQIHKLRLETSETKQMPRQGDYERTQKVERTSISPFKMKINELAQPKQPKFKIKITPDQLANSSFALSPARNSDVESDAQLEFTAECEEISAQMMQEIAGLRRNIIATRLQQSTMIAERQSLRQMLDLTKRDLKTHLRYAKNLIRKTEERFDSAKQQEA